MPYTSGTTGKPKGRVHTHRSVMSTLVGGTVWFSCSQDAVYLSALPFFHVTGMSGSMNGPMYVGATVVVLPRWDREGLPYIEGYGMSETMAATRLNPPQRPKPQCLGVPVFDVDARIVDPETLRELPPGEHGEIVVHGPQVMQG